MKTIRTLLAMTTALMGLMGCSSVYYYETDKISVSLEARPDPTAPIQGNIGVKQRIVAFVPPTTRKALSPTEASAAMTSLDASAKKEIQDDMAKSDMASARKAAFALLANEDEIINGDALSVLSSLRFHKFPKPSGASILQAGRITIDSSLITGNAAKIVTNPGTALQALSGAGSTGVPLQKLAALSTIYGTLATDTSTQAPVIKADLDSLKSLLPDKYPFTVYKAGKDAADIGIYKSKDDGVKKDDFNDVLEYVARLEHSALVLNILKLPKFTVGGADATPQTTPSKDDVSAAVKAGEDLTTKILGSQAAKHAVSYFFGATQ
jgi:hypothetical protein